MTDESIAELQAMLDDRRKDACDRADKLARLRAAEQSARDYIAELTDDQIGSGDDPVGFLVASHRVLANELARLREIDGKLGGIDCEWRPTRWVHKGDARRYSLFIVSVELQVSPFYEGERYAIRNGAGSCLNTSGEWEHEPLPSSRDDAFYERCRFKSWKLAEAAARDARGA